MGKAKLSRNYGSMSNGKILLFVPKKHSMRALRIKAAELQNFGRGNLYVLLRWLPITSKTAFSCHAATPSLRMYFILLLLKLTHLFPSQIPAIPFNSENTLVNVNAPVTTAVAGNQPI